MMIISILTNNIITMIIKLIISIVTNNITSMIKCIVYNYNHYSKCDRNVILIRGSFIFFCIGISCVNSF